MELEEKHLSIKTALRFEFDSDCLSKERAVDIYNTSLAMGYKEQAEEMKSDIEFEFNIKLD